MGEAKNIILMPIKSKQANEFIKQRHYSGKVVQNSQLHIGVFLNGKIEGVMQFGPSLDKRKLQGLVEGTKWHNFIELNRMAFTNALPRNSESRAISIAMKLIKKHAPQIKWVVTFADATQCGDGTIYRASGFVLTSIKENGQLYKFPMPDNMPIDPLFNNGLSEIEINILKSWLASMIPHKMSLEGAPHAHKMSLEGAPHAHKMSLENGNRPNQLLSQVKEIMRKVTGGGTSADKLFKLMGGTPASGFQLRYIYFIDKAWEDRLTVPKIPFSVIKETGANMYLGSKN